MWECVCIQFYLFLSVYLSINQDIHFKELAHTIVGSSQSKLCKADWLAEEQEI